MTKAKKPEAAESTLEERVRTKLANFLAEVADEEAPGANWSTTTLPAMLRPVLIDLNRHLFPRPKMPPRPPVYRAKTSRPPRTLEERQAEDRRRGVWTAAELMEAVRGDE
jgi:hypothetical protein